MRKKRLTSIVLAGALVLSGCGGATADVKDSTSGTAVSGGSKPSSSTSAVINSEETSKNGGESPEMPAEVPAPEVWDSSMSVETEASISESFDMMKGDMVAGDLYAGSIDMEEGAIDPGFDVAPPSEIEEIIPTIVPKAGLLTAGEWRDNDNWGFLVNLVQTGNFYFHHFGIAPYRRVVVKAESNGMPVKSAKVTLVTDPASSQQPLARAVTDHNGVAYLYYDCFGTAKDVKPGYVVIEANGAQAVIQEIDESKAQYVTATEIAWTQQEWYGTDIVEWPVEEMEIEVGDPATDLTDVKETAPVIAPDEAWASSGSAVIADDPNHMGGDETGNVLLIATNEMTVEVPDYVEPSKALDVMFVFDTTGSMGDELLYLQKEFTDIAERVADQSTRFSVNFYRDFGDDYVVKPYPLQYDFAELSQYMNSEFANGGGDYEEAVDIALKNAVLEHEWAENSVKLVFFILDAPPHDTAEVAANLEEALTAAMAMGIRIIPIASSGVDTKTEGLLRSMAMLTGGTYTFLTDDSGIGGSHLEPTVGAYEVEPLNDMIVRLIEEYYGK